MPEEQTKSQIVHLDFIAADENNPDPATVGEFGRAVVNLLLNDGYDVKPFYTGEKGGEHFIVSIIQFALDHKDGIANTVSFIGGAATNLGNVKTIIESIEKIQSKLNLGHHDSESVVVTLKADGTELVQGTPEAVSKYVVEHKKNLTLVVSVPKKAKKRRK